MSQNISDFIMPDDVLLYKLQMADRFLSYGFPKCSVKLLMGDKDRQADDLCMKFKPQIYTSEEIPSVNRPMTIIKKANTSKKNSGAKTS